MASITTQRDLVLSLKRETILNVRILSKLHPMPTDLSRQVFKDNALEKPTQNVFNHLAYFLVSLIDQTISASLPWPLYDTKTERTYRNDLSNFITDYSNKGLLSPVMSSYLVNPGCYKVTFLIFQLSQLAVQKVLVTKMHKESQKRLYTDVTELYKTKDEAFIERIDKETESMLSKFSNYFHRRKVFEKAADIFKTKIIQMEDTLEKSEAQEMIDNLVNGFLKQNTVDEDIKPNILRFKNVHEKPKILENWLTTLDDQINDMEKTWDKKITPFLSICQKTAQNSETVIARHMGEADRKTFAVEYNSKTDEICTQELQCLVNSQQKYVLKNIVKEDKLNFPNLIRGFLISVCFLLKNTEIDADIDIFNEYLNGGRSNYTEVVAAMRNLLERVMNAECSLSPPSQKYNMSVSFHELTVIPPMPDLSKLKMNRDPPNLPYDFTPLNLTKHKFNLHKRNTNNSFTKPLPKMPSLITPFHHSTQRDDFFKNVASCRVSSYDQNMSLNLHNVSAISHISKANETIAKCNAGFTQQQIFRLLSTKKSTSSKKLKHKNIRPSMHIVKGGLFNESTLSNDNGLYRSHSSPNLLEVRDTRSIAKNRARKLSIMKEGSPCLLEVSGITALDRDSKHSTPQSDVSMNKLVNAKSLPGLVVTDTSGYSSIVRDDLNKEIQNSTLEYKNKPTVLIECESSDIMKTQESTENIQADSCNVVNDIIMDTQKTSVKLQTKRSQQSHIPRRKTANVVAERKSSENHNCGPRSMDYAKLGSKEDINTFKSMDSLQVPSKFTENVSRKSTEKLSTQNSTESHALRKSTENSQVDRKSTDLQRTETDTPTTKSQLIKKTSSLEKIINRFKKIRPSIVPDFTANMEDSNTNEFKTIIEEKENINFNMNTVNLDVFTANRVLLPDLLSPSCSILGEKPADLNQLGFELSLDEEEIKPRKPRESLGTMLGVDHTVLDPIDWID